MAEKRVTVFQNGFSTEGKVVSVEGTFLEFLQVIGQEFEIEAKRLFTSNGGEICDIKVIRDEEYLYVSDGELFIVPPPPAHRASRRPTSSRTTTTAMFGGPVPDIKRWSVGTNDWITLNVGGKCFTTTRSTLTAKEPDSMLARMFIKEEGHMWCSSVDPNGAFLLDRSPTYFEPVLNYLRHGELVLDKHISVRGVLEEARFFGILSMVELLEARIHDEEPATDFTPINRREFILHLLSTPSTSELRCQGVSFAGINLSKLDLRNINFKYSVFRGANLSGANLSNCNLERADMCRAHLDGANLLGAKMLCVNLESASLQGCNFEDPAGSRTNMEGANMKSVNLEGSHMAGVNLRVATLKNANLQNCDLRGAVLAGADLENCNLSGCDLQEANLRGANLKGAAFELMLNPLHMSQTIR